MDHDKILNFMRMNGPTTPTSVAKNIKSDVLLAAALLSDLSAQNKVKVSKLKIGGGSPLYYLTGQEDQLFKFAESNLNPKDYHVLLQLKESKLLREKELELLAKVALRGMKDFAIPLNVNIQGQTELFWKWHLLSNEDANKMIGDFINGQQEVPVEKPEAKPEPEVKQPEPEVVKEQPVPDTTEQMVKASPVKEVIPEQPVPELKKEVKAEAEVKRPEPKVVEKKVEEIKREPEVKQPKPEVKKEEVKEEQKKLPTEEKKSFIQKVKDKVVKKRKTVDDEFLPQLEHFFTSLKIKIEQKETLRKNAEMNFLLTVPSVVGNITYFCKAKNKSRCDERDLSAAYMEAQSKRLPLLFLYTNELNKKSLELMESGAFENVAVKKVD